MKVEEHGYRDEKRNCRPIALEKCEREDSRQRKDEELKYSNGGGKRSIREGLRADTRFENERRRHS